MDLITSLTILVLAAFVGFEVISKVPNSLHTPLMSATNAIHGIVLLGGILVIGEVHGFFSKFILVIAIAFGTINVVGGFLVTDRMLEMFKARPKPADKERLMQLPLATFLTDTDFIRVLYIVAFSLFILGMRQVTGPTTARRGNATAAVGMAIAVIATLLIPAVGDYGLIALGIAIGTAVGVPAARNVKMTAMPQMVALFNGVGGGAVALISWAEYRHALDSGLGNPELDTLIPILFAAIIGSVSFWGSNIAFGKLQDILPQRPIAVPGQQFVNAVVLIVAVGAAVLIAGGAESQGLFVVILLAAGVAGQPRGAAHRRRRHAGGHLAAERADRPLGRRRRHRAGQHRADRGRHHRRRLGHDPDQPHGRGHEPLDPQHRGGRLRRRRGHLGAAATPRRSRTAPPTPCPRRWR